MQLSGKVSNIIYHNEKNGYTVFLLKSEGDYITVVGDGTGVEAGDTINIEGEFTYHKTYGEQFLFSKLEKELPADSESLVTYIANSEVKGVGEKTAQRIIKKFGDDALEVIRYKPDLLVSTEDDTLNTIPFTLPFILIL